MKKNLVLGLVMSLYSSVILGQQIKANQVPSNVLQAFQQKFGSANNVEWEMDEANFEVNFEIGNVEWSAKYDQSGKLLETEREIELSEVPQIVKQSIDKSFPKCKLKEVEEVTLDDNLTVYEFELKQNRKKFEVQVSKSGEIIRSSEIKSTNKEDND